MKISLTLRKDQLVEMLDDMLKALEERDDVVYAAILDDHITQKCRYRINVQTTEGHDHQTGKLTAGAKAVFSIEVTLSGKHIPN